MITRFQNLTFRLARQEDFSTLQAIYNEAGRWLHDVKGISDQWDREMSAVEVQSLIDRQETYLVYQGESLIGAIRLTPEKEVPWEEAPGDAFYVHELVVKREFAGLGLGKQILAFAGEKARQAGKPYLRLDCMAENPRLCRYYEEAGFHPLGQHPLHRWYTLFEKNVTADGEINANVIIE